MVEQICIARQWYLRENGNADVEVFQDSLCKLFQDSNETFDQLSRSWKKTEASKTLSEEEDHILWMKGVLETMSQGHLGREKVYSQQLLHSCL